MLRYPDGARDAEALLIDPRTGTVVIVTKDFGGRSDVYVAGRDGLRKRGRRLQLGIGQAITAGDVSGDGRTIVLRSYDRAFVWTKRRSESIATALERAPCTAGADLIEEGQGEALALTRDGRAFYTVPEGAGAPAAPIRALSGRDREPVAGRVGPARARRPATRARRS